MLWVLILGLHLGVQSFRLPEAVPRISSRALLILWVVSLTIAATRIAGHLVRYYGGQLQGALPARV